MFRHGSLVQLNPKRLHSFLGSPYRSSFSAPFQYYPLPAARFGIMPKRKSLSTATEGSAITSTPIPPPDVTLGDIAPPAPKRRASGRKVSQPAQASTNPNENANILDGPQALRASPDAEGKDERLAVEQAGMDAQKQIKEEEPVVNGATRGKPKKGSKKGAIQEASAQEVNGEVTNPKGIDPDATKDSS